LCDFAFPRSRQPALLVARGGGRPEARFGCTTATMTSLFERQRADVETRLDAIVRGPAPVTSKALLALQGALGLDDLRLRDDGTPTEAPGSESRSLVEHALCRLAHRLVEEASKANVPAMQYSPGSDVPSSTSNHSDDAMEKNYALPRALDLSLVLSELGVADPGSVFVIVEQVLETSTVEEAARVFGWLENRRRRVSEPALWKRGKLVTLRTCNDLSRRLSKGKASDVVLRGRVSLFVAALYPLSERSALNASGAYNYEENLSASDPADPKPEEDPEADFDGSSSSKIHRAFRETFWNLQVFFRQPVRGAGADAQAWNAFRNSLECVLTAFESDPLDQSFAAEAEAEAANRSEALAAKYVKSPPLLRVQMRDPVFRRHFLTQCAVYLNHRIDILRCARSSASSVGSEGVASGEGRSKRRRLKPCTVAATVERECETSLRNVLAHLAEVPPSGAAFARAVAVALRRERHWTRWKREGCPSFERVADPELFFEAPVSKSVRLGKETPDRPGKRGEADSDDVAAGLAEASRERSEEMSSERYLAAVHEDADPEADIEEAYKRKNDPAFRWKMTRLLAEENFGAFIRLASEDVERIAAEVLGQKPWPGKDAPPDAPEAPNPAEGGKEEEDVPPSGLDATERVVAPDVGAEDSTMREAADCAADADADADADAEADAPAAREPQEAHPSRSQGDGEKIQRVQKTKTKTGGGEHTRFVSTPATTEDWGGDSDMGSDSEGRSLMNMA